VLQSADVMRSRLRACSVATIVAAGCASVSSGPYGTRVDDNGHPANGPPAVAGLKVSGTTIDQLSSPSFGVVELTFENESASWIRIRRARLDFGTARLNEAVAIPAGADLEAWRQAIVERMIIRADPLASPVFFALGAARHRHGTGPVPGPLEAQPVEQSIATFVAPPAEQSGPAPAFPPYHLYAVPIAVPPGLFAKRWVVLSTPRWVGCIRRVIVEYEIEDGRQERVALAVRDRPEAGSSEWQEAECR
jgi:hypothetical protein